MVWATRCALWSGIPICGIVAGIGELGMTRDRIASNIIDATLVSLLVG